MSTNDPARRAAESCAKFTAHRMKRHLNVNYTELGIADLVEEYEPIIRTEYANQVGAEEASRKGLIDIVWRGLKKRSTTYEKSGEMALCIDWDDLCVAMDDAGITRLAPDQSVRELVTHVDAMIKLVEDYEAKTVKVLRTVITMGKDDWKVEAKERESARHKMVDFLEELRAALEKVNSKPGATNNAG